MSWKELTLFEEGVHTKGIAPDLAVSPPGFVRSAENLRWEGGELKVRNGLSSILPSGPSVTGGELVGSLIIQDSASTHVAFAGLYDPGVGKVRIFFNQFGAVPNTWGGWFESTAANGKWGDTRLPGRPKSPIHLVGIPGQYGVGRVAVQSGIEGEPARMIRLSSPGECPKVKPIEPPLALTATSPLAGCADSLNVAAGSWTVSGTGGFAASVQQTNPNQFLRFAAASGASAGATAQAVLPLANSMDATSSAQLWLMASISGALPSWQNLTVDVLVGSGLTAHRVFDPAGGREEIMETDPCFEAGGASFRLYAFPIPTLAQVRGIRILAAQALPSGFQLDIAWIAASGWVPGGAQYGVSLASSATGSESPGVVLLASELAESINQDSLGRAARALSEGYGTSGSQSLPGTLALWGTTPVNPILPLTDGLFYSVRVPILAPASTAASEGVDEVRIYRRDPGETEFSLAAAWPIARWNGTAWAPGATYGPAAAATAWNEVLRAVDNLPRHQKDLSFRLPDGFCTSMPSGGPLLFANGRLYVGSRTDSAGAVWVSEQDQPLRFRETARVTEGELDEVAGGIVALGPSPVTALASLSSSLVGTTAVLAFSKEEMFRIEGLRGIKALDEGTLSPWSVQASSSGVFWLTSDRQAVVYEGILSDLSRNRIEGLLRAIPEERLPWVSCFKSDDSLLLAFSEPGDGNLRVAVYDRHLQGWESVDRLPGNLGVSLFVSWRDRPAYWTSSGALVRWDDPDAADDLGTPITFRLTSGETASPKGGFVRLRRMGVLGSGGIGSLVCRREGVGPAGMAEGTVTLEEGSTFRWDSGLSGEPVGLKGERVWGELSGTAPVGWRLRRWTVEARIGSRGARGAG